MVSTAVSDTLHLARRLLVGCECRCGPETQRQRSPLFNRVDRNDLRSARDACALDCGDADTADSEDDDRLAWADAGRVYDCTEPRAHAASEQARLFEWRIFGNGHHSTHRHEDALDETSNTYAAQQSLSLTLKPCAATWELGHGTSRPTGCGMARRARVTTSAGGRNRYHHGVALRNVCNTITNAIDPSRDLMAKYDGRKRAVTHQEV
jgi:hypothetical protein